MNASQKLTQCIEHSLYLYTDLQIFLLITQDIQTQKSLSNIKVSIDLSITYVFLLIHPLCFNSQSRRATILLMWILFKKSHLLKKVSSYLAVILTCYLRLVFIYVGTKGIFKPSRNYSKFWNSSMYLSDFEIITSSNSVFKYVPKQPVLAVVDLNSAGQPLVSL